MYYLFLDIPPPFLTEYTYELCPVCGDSKQGEMGYRECVWYEATDWGAVVPLSSRHRSERCNDTTLTLPCPKKLPFRK